MKTDWSALKAIDQSAFRFLVDTLSMDSSPDEKVIQESGPPHIIVKPWETHQLLPSDDDTLNRSCQRIQFASSKAGSFSYNRPHKRSVGPTHLFNRTCESLTTMFHLFGPEASSKGMIYPKERRRKQLREK